MKKIFNIIVCIIAIAAFISCGKDMAFGKKEAPDPPKKVDTPKVHPSTPDTLPHYISFMETYVDKRNFDTSSIFQYLTYSVTFDGKRLSGYWQELDIVYSHNHAFYPSTLYPRFYQFVGYQKVWDYTIGVPPGTDCPTGVTLDLTVELTVIMPDGRKFFWKYCPLRIFAPLGTVFTDADRIKTLVIYAKAKTSNTVKRTFNMSPAAHEQIFENNILQ